MLGQSPIICRMYGPYLGGNTVTKAIVIIGTIFDGLSFVGPFDDIEDAFTWAEHHAEEWQVATLNEAAQ